MVLVSERDRPCGRSGISLAPLFCALLLSSVGCESNVPPRSDECSDECTFEGTCGFVLGCTRDRECPRGTACVRPTGTVLAAPNDLPLQECARETDRLRSWCRVELTPVDRSALVSGFGRGSFELARVPADESEHVTFTWPRVGDATTMTCALFTCEPEVRPTPDPGVDGERRIIDNFARCTVGYRAFQPAEGAFSVDRETMTRVRALGHRRMTTLVAGCWASNETRVVAASLLERVEPEEAPWVAAFSDCSGAGTDGDNCWTELESIGTCRGLRCRYRCSTRRDCLRALSTLRMMSEPVDAGAPEGDAGVSSGPTVVCEVPPGEFVGECIETNSEGA